MFLILSLFLKATNFSSIGEKKKQERKLWAVKENSVIAIYSVMMERLHEKNGRAWFNGQFTTKDKNN